MKVYENLTNTTSFTAFSVHLPGRERGKFVPVSAIIQLLPSSDMTNCSHESGNIARGQYNLSMVNNIHYFIPSFVTVKTITPRSCG